MSMSICFGCFEENRCDVSISLILTLVFLSSKLKEKHKGNEVMPIYEYKCDKCSRQFEVVTMSMNEKANAVCPKCKSRKTSRMMSQFGRGKYASLSSGSSGVGSAPGSSGCSSCSSSNCSSCGH